MKYIGELTTKALDKPNNLETQNQKNPITESNSVKAAFF